MLGQPGTHFASSSDGCCFLAQFEYVFDLICGYAIIGADDRKLHFIIGFFDIKYQRCCWGLVNYNAFDTKLRMAVFTILGSAKAVDARGFF